VIRCGRTHPQTYHLWRRGWGRRRPSACACGGHGRLLQARTSHQRKALRSRVTSRGGTAALGVSVPLAKIGCAVPVLSTPAPPLGAGQGRARRPPRRGHRDASRAIAGRSPSSRRLKFSEQRLGDVAFPTMCGMVRNNIQETTSYDCVSFAIIFRSYRQEALVLLGSCMIFVDNVVVMHYI
jgi:hypothetical protein